ncbi:MAG: flagellar hook protein FlgE [Nitrospirota bacterium]
MAILTSLFSGVSGLNANGSAMSVIGNNIANVNTVGFKSSRTTFADIISQSLGGGSASSQIGRGVFLSSVSPSFTQGSFETTSNALDLGVDGNGFFLVKNSSGQFYTRAGQFTISKDGNVVNPEGFVVQGYQVDSAGTINGVIDDINISAATSAPRNTQNVTITANIDSRSTIPAAFSVSTPTTTSNFSTAMTAYDSLGNGHLITVYFRKNQETVSGNTWQWFAVVNSSDTMSGADEIQASGTLVFDNAGALSSETTSSSSFNFTGGASQGQNIAFEFGTSITEGGTGLDGTTQFGSTSATIFQSQDGYSSGALQGISINQDGIISGLFTNGQTRVLGQVILSIFNNPHGLTRLGKNLYAESFESGQAIIGAPSTGGRGRVLSNSLELSNVDLAEEFIKIITAQRGFEANSRTITTTDLLLGELVNIKR